MQTTIRYNPEISDLRELALAVMRPEAQTSLMSARTAARCLSGVVRLVAQRWGTMAMHQACAELVRTPGAWTRGAVYRSGDLQESVETIAVVARGILDLAGDANMRAALSFWASESDPAVWTSLIAG